jgi:hypothetical protein
MIGRLCIVGWLERGRTTKVNHNVGQDRRCALWDVTDLALVKPLVLEDAIVLGMSLDMSNGHQRQALLVVPE